MVLHYIVIILQILLDIKDKKMYSNPNVLVRQRVKKMPKDDLDDDFDIKFVV